MITKHDIEDILTLSKTLYGESEVNNKDDAEAIACVVMNRVSYPTWPDDVSQVCLQPWQFSCWNPNDPGRARITKAKGKWFDQCRAIAEQAVLGKLYDKTNGSTHYYATYIRRPKWAKNKTPVYEVAHNGGHYHLFYNNIDTKPPKSAKEALDQTRPIMETKTVASGAVAGGTMTVATAVQVADVLNDTRDQIQPLTDYSEIIATIFMIVSLLAIGAMIWIRINDRKKGIR